MSRPKAYENWSTEPHARWIDAGNTFGWHLLGAAREYAFKRIDKSATAEARAAAERAALDAIYGMMMLLDGVTPADSGNARIEYVLLARVNPQERERNPELIELAPDGDGLCMGFQGWVAGDFGA
jgi:hypothetical protein